MKLVTNIHHASGQCCKDFQGQRSKVKVMTSDQTQCYNGGVVQFSGVSSKLTCLLS